MDDGEGTLGRYREEEDTTEERVEDHALELLRESGLFSGCCGSALMGACDEYCSSCRDHADGEYECPACGKAVEEDDAEDHARTCKKLLDAAWDEMSAPDPRDDLWRETR